MKTTRTLEQIRRDGHATRLFACALFGVSLADGVIPVEGGAVDLLGLGLPAGFVQLADDLSICASASAG